MCIVLFLEEVVKKRKINMEWLFLLLGVSVKVFSELILFIVFEVEVVWMCVLTW